MVINVTFKVMQSEIKKASFLQRLAGYDAFLSHARLDGAEIAKEIQSAERKLLFFLDTHGIVQGEDISIRISKALANSRLLLVLLTTEGYRSKWVAKEIRDFGCGGDVIPVLIDPPPEDATPETIEIRHSLGANCVGFNQHDIVKASLDAMESRIGWYTKKRAAIAKIACLSVLIAAVVFGSLVYARQQNAIQRLNRFGEYDRKNGTLLVNRETEFGVKDWQEFEVILNRTPKLKELDIRLQPNLESLRFLEQQRKLTTLHLYGLSLIHI